MPSAGGYRPTTSPRGRDNSARKGAPEGPPEGPLSVATASSRSTTEGGPPYSSVMRNELSDAPAAHSSAREWPSREGGLQAAPTGYHAGYAERPRVASPLPRVLGESQGGLNLRAPRGSPRGPPLHAPANGDRGVYVHLTDSECGSGAEEAEGPGGYIRGSPGPFGGPSWGRRRGPPPSRLADALSCLSVYSRLAVRRLTLGCRFLLFWARDNERQLKVLLYTATLLVSSTGNTIAFKRMLDKMPNYSGFLNQLTNFVFIPVFAAFCIYQYSVGKLSQEVLRFPKRNFAVMGCLDGVCGIIPLFQLVHLCGHPLPKQMVVYNAIQHLGAAVIILGVLVVESPGLLHPSAEDSSNLPFFNLLFLLSILPSSLSYVVKEVAFRGVQMNTSFLQFWVALFQFVVGFVLLPLTSLPLLGSEGVPLNQLWGRLVDGGRCLFGVNSILPPGCGPAVGLACDACEGAWVEVLVYVLFNLIYNVCAMLVLKHCGATVLFLVMTVRLPLTSMAFYSKLIVGDSAVAAKPTDFFGLVILLVGLLAFRLGGQKPPREDEEENGGEEGSLERDITATAEARADILTLNPKS
ncbi:hypothetical protein Efla_006863 [Eimeria flavescens]